jgi:hypothetical protein
MSKEIFQVIKERRNGRNRKAGVMVAVEENGVVHIGWSRVNSRHDSFDMDKGLEIARGRAKAKTPVVYPLGSSHKPLNRFEDRAKRYFKNSNVVSVTQKFSFSDLQKLPEHLDGEKYLDKLRTISDLQKLPEYINGEKYLDKLRTMLTNIV